MILEFKVKNFLSFKEQVTFSFEATDDNYLSDYQIVTMPDGTKILKLAMIYGANASGKSNLLASIDLLVLFAILTSKFDNPYAFKYDKATINAPSEFELTFYVDGTKYQYILHIANNFISKEELFTFSRKKKILIFTRKQTAIASSFTIKIGEKYKISKAIKDTLLLNTKNHNTILSTIAKLNIYAFYNEFFKTLNTLYDWFLGIKSIKKTDIELNKRYFSDIKKDEQKYKPFILKNIQKADINIVDFDIKKDRNNKLEIFFHHKLNEEIFTFEIFEESEGTEAYFILLYELVEMINNEYQILCFDELENSLHPELINHYINLFLYQTKGKNCQFIFTTHNTSLLDEEFIRHDIVWFTEKKADGSTDLYSLAEFKDIPKNILLSQAYRIGKFGAVPKIKPIN